MEELKNRYFALNSALNRDLGDLNGLKISYLRSFKRKHIFTHRDKLKAHISTFDEIDREYRNCLNTNDAINDLLIKNARVSVLEKARSLPSDTISEYQRTILNSEACINFNVTTAIAVVALFLSFIGIVN